MPPTRSLLSHHARRIATATAFIITVTAATMAAPPAGYPAVLLNELKIQDVVQSLELWNTGPGRVALDNLGFQGVDFSIFPLATNDTLEVGEHRVLVIPPSGPDEIAVIRKRGDCLELFDANLDAVIDRVDCGDSGGAPLDIEAEFPSTLARTTPVPDPGGTNSADFWTVDFTGTLGAPNVVPPPALGGDVVINEVIPGPDDSVRVEVFNRTGAPIDLLGWSLTSAICHVHLAGILPPNGHRIFPVIPLVFTFNLTVYLFDPNGERVDQMGFSDAPGDPTTYVQVLGDGESFQRLPDGAGPNDGYDLPTIDFGGTVQTGPPSPGGPNGGPQGVEAEGPSPIPVQLVARPNPAGVSTEIVLDWGSGGRGSETFRNGERIEIVDAMGRIVDVLRPAPGARVVIWLPGSKRPAGTYFAVVRWADGAAAEAVKVVVAR
jgi:hypothetical protein